MATATKERPAKGKTQAGITLATDALRRALSTVKSAVGGLGKPVLANVYIGNGVAEATDLEMRISCEIDYHETPVLLPHQRLTAILSSAGSAGEVTLSAGDTSCVVAVGSGRWTLPTESAAEFPTWSVDDEKRRPVARIPADQFARAVRAVAYACDNESSRFALGGVLVEVKDGTATVVATDGRRLSRVDVEIDQAVDDTVTLWPSRAINVVASIASHSNDAVQLETAGNELIATIGGTVIAARVLEGRFPRWRDVFPERDVRATVLNAAELLSATRQAAIVTSEQSKGVQFVITKDGIHLTARSSEAGESSVTCPFLEFGQAASVKLDPHFVCDFLRACDDGEPAEIEAVDSQSAVVLRCGDYHGVIMPLAEDAT
jgi:DNA polymerase III subunit beta